MKKELSLVSAAKSLPNMLAYAVDAQDDIKHTAAQIAQMVGCDANFSRGFGISTAAYFSALSKTEGYSYFCKSAPETIIGALCELARYRLTLDTAAANAYLVPYNGVCQLQLGWRGYVAIIRRHFPNFHTIMEFATQSELNDFSVKIRYENGKNISQIIHSFDKSRLMDSPQQLANSAAVMYCLAYLKEGELLQVATMSRKECEFLRLLSPTQKSKNNPTGEPRGVWRAHYLQMWKAKLMRRVCKSLFSADGLIEDYIHTVNTNGEIESTPIEYDDTPQNTDFDGAEVVAGVLAQIQNAANLDALNAVAQSISELYGKGNAPALVREAFIQKQKALKNG